MIGYGDDTVKVLIFGLGSIGERHAQNLQVLMPDAVQIHADPKMDDWGAYGDLYFSDWRSALAAHTDADAAIIASPTECHAEQMAALSHYGIPFYCEKPLLEVGQNFGLIYGDVLHRIECAVGFQYRFHPIYRQAAPIIRRHGYVRFAANENLLARYGPDCLSVIAAHPIDTALWLLGPAHGVEMETDGLSVSGVIYHEHSISGHEYRIDTGPRMSIVKCNEMVWSLDPTNDMYLDALRAWLAWVNGAPRDERTATLADGLESMRVMAQIKRKEIVQC